MKLATIRNGELIYLAANLPKRAKLNLSVWAKIPGEVAPRRTDMTPDAFFNVRQFLANANAISAYIDLFFENQGLADGVETEGYGMDVYRWR